MIGTQHLAPQDDPRPSEAQIDTLLGEINLSVPDLGLSRDNVSQVLFGRLPPSSAGSPIPAKSAKIVTGQALYGFENLTCVESPKYTTARHVAEHALRQADRGGSLKLKKNPSNVPRPPHSSVRNIENGELSEALVRDLQLWVEEESVIHLDDLILRRCDLDLESQLTIRRHLANKLKLAVPC